MLSDRDRRTLGEIEHHLRLADPALARMFETGPPRRPADLRLRLLVAALILIPVTAVLALPAACAACGGLAVAVPLSYAIWGRPPSHQGGTS